MEQPSARWQIWLIAIIVGGALNLVPAFVEMGWDTPLFLDAVGTITFTLLGGWPVGAAAGVVSLLVGGLFNAHMPYFVFTEFMIAVVAGISARRGGFRGFGGIIITGVVMGLVAAVVSAPAVALAFPAAPQAGQSAIAAFWAGTGAYLQQTLASKAAWVEPVDKTLQCLLAAGLVRILPETFKRRLQARSSPSGH